MFALHPKKVLQFPLPRLFRVHPCVHTNLIQKFLNSSGIGLSEDLALFSELPVTCRKAYPTTGTALNLLVTFLHRRRSALAKDLESVFLILIDVNAKLLPVIMPLYVDGRAYSQTLAEDLTLGLAVTHAANNHNKQ
ncbi:hypothetical protein L916_21267, partial [Phytophthora nicotianae]